MTATATAFAAIDRKREKQRIAIERYRSLVQRVALDATADDGEVDQILEAASVEPSKFAMDVAKQRSRDEAHRKLAQFVGAETLIDEVREAIEAERAKLRAAELQFHSAIAPLNVELARLNRMCVERPSLEQQLAAGATEDLAIAMRENRNKLSEAAEQKWQAEREASTYEGGLAALTADDDRRPQYTRLAAQWRATYEAAAALATELVEEQNRLFRAMIQS